MSMTDRAPDYDDKQDEGPRQTGRSSRGTTVLEPNEARGAVRHHNVGIVLGVSLGVAVLALAVIYVAFFNGQAPS